MRVQFKEYLERAEYLKSINNGQDASGPQQGTGAAQKVRKPGAKGGEEVRLLLLVVVPLLFGL